MRQGQMIDLVAPGFLGLNTVQSGALLPPQYAVTAHEAVIGPAGRLAARKGHLVLTTTPITGTPAIKTIFEHRTATGTTETIVAWNGGISNSVTNPQGSDISGAVTDTNGIWNMQNYAGNVVIGFQHGQKPVIYSGTTFATIVESAGTAPTIHQGVGLCAFGRVWGLDSDGHTIKYSVLLDETDWSTANGAGSLDLQSVWGNDECTGLASFNGSLVIFGKKHVLFYTDGAGSANGIDPAQMYLSDMISGTGCITWRSIQAVGESDLLFLSKIGVQSLARVVQEKSNPLTTVTKKVRDIIVADVGDILASPHTVASAYSSLEGFYIISFPGSRTYVLDQRKPYVDPEDNKTLLNIVTTWGLAPTALHVHDNTTLYMAVSGGKVSQYSGTDDDGASYRFVYKSPWLDLGEEVGNRLKMLKRLGAIVFVGADMQLVYKWWVDFDSTGKSITRSFSAAASTEWGVAEWGIGEWGGGVSLYISKVPARGKGQYYQLGIEGDVLGTFALQQVELFTKIGRYA